VLGGQRQLSVIVQQLDGFSQGAMATAGGGNLECVALSNADAAFEVVYGGGGDLNWNPIAANLNAFHLEDILANDGPTSIQIQVATGGGGSSIWSFSANGSISDKYIPFTAFSGGVSWNDIDRITLTGDPLFYAWDVRIGMFEAVPEPCDYAMATGLGLVAFMFYRRSRSSRRLSLTRSPVGRA
jgi:hypothetical protein